LTCDSKHTYIFFLPYSEWSLLNSKWANFSDISWEQVTFDEMRMMSAWY